MQDIFVIAIVINFVIIIIMSNIGYLYLLEPMFTCFG